MEDLERRVLELESKIKSELGADSEDGQVWRVINGHTERLTKIDDTVWRGNGKDSIVTQLVRLRTELRTIAVVMTVLLPIGVKLLDKIWLGAG